MAHVLLRLLVPEAETLDHIEHGGLKHVSYDHVLQRQSAYGYGNSGNFFQYFKLPLLKITLKCVFMLGAFTAMMTMAG